MSIDKVIDNIAVLAEKRNEPSYLKDYFYIDLPCCPPLSSTWEAWGLDWKIVNQSSQSVNTCGVALIPSQEKIKELNQYLYDKGHSPPKLNLEQIQEITADYPFQLPVEVYRLYQRSNSIFPIGLGNKDWESFDNYFILELTSRAEALFSLQDAMSMYRNFSSCKIDPRMFPIMYFETEELWAVMGSSEQQESSPVYSVDVDGSPAGIVYSSLTELLSTWLDKDENK